MTFCTGADARYNRLIRKYLSANIARCAIRAAGVSSDVSIATNLSTSFWALQVCLAVPVADYRYNSRMTEAAPEVAFVMGYRLGLDARLALLAVGFFAEKTFRSSAGMPPLMSK
jgi:hypothetical protein